MFGSMQNNTVLSDAHNSASVHTNGGNAMVWRLVLLVALIADEPIPLQIPLSWELYCSC